MTSVGGPRSEDHIVLASAAEQRRVSGALVVGEGGPVRDRTTNVLQADGWTVRCCADGAAAIETVTTQRVGIIVSDAELSDMSGVQLFRLLDQEPVLAGVALVLLARPGDNRVRLFANCTCPRAHVIQSPDEEIPPLLERLERSASATDPPALAPVAPQLLTRRLSSALDEAMVESVVAGEVRALAASEGYLQFFAGLESLVRRLLSPIWVALLVDRSPAATLFLSAPVGRRAESESAARAAFAAGNEVRCAAFRPASATTEAFFAAEVPVFSGTNQCGQLAVGLPKNSHVHAARRLVDLIASELGGPWRIVSLLEEARRTAATDPLTGLMNRRALLEQIGRESSRAQRYGHSLTVLILDIDHFKHVNDKHGHFAGDRVIQTVAATATRALRQSDYIGRWGGEEFLIALPCTDVIGGLTTAERLRTAVEEAATTSADGSVLRATISIGAAHGLSPWLFEDLARSADAALYEAKARGRNRVCSFNEIRASS